MNLVDTIQAHERVPASQFRRNPHNRTPSEEMVTQLAVSIREVGVLQPITARPAKDEATGESYLEIVMGEGRWRACQEIDAQFPVPVFIRPELDDKQTAKLLAVENFQRAALDRVEEARALAHMKATGWTVDEITEAVGLKRSQVFHLLAVLRLPPEGVEAVREGVMALHTAELIVSLPEDLQEEAVRAVVKPVHSSSPLPREEAVKLLRKQYVEPLKKAAEWRERRHLLENEHNPAQWLDYEEALKIGEWESGHVDVMARPYQHLLAPGVELERVPTWLELARKHGARTFIGLDAKGREAVVYVEMEPLMEAEKASVPAAECIFRVKGGAAENLDEEERKEAARLAREKKVEVEREEAALTEERGRFVQAILSGRLSKAGTKRLAVALAEWLVEEEYFSEDFLCQVYPGVPEFSEEQQAEGAVVEWCCQRLALELAHREVNPVERIGALVLAAEIEAMGGGAFRERLAKLAIRVAGLKEKDFPTLAKLAEEAGE